MTGQPRTITEIIAAFTGALDRANTTYNADVARIKANPDRRTHQELGHMDRRVLDPSLEATWHHHLGMYAVKTGLNTPILHENAEDAIRQAMIHNHIWGHQPIVDRRVS